MIHTEDCKVENGCICIPRETIQSWIDHYDNVADGYDMLSKKMYYIGKRDAFINLLKTIEFIEQTQPDTTDDV